MYSTCRLFKHTYFILLRSLQNISQSYIKCTENTLFIYNNDDSGIIIIITAVISGGNSLKIKKKFSFK